MKTVNLFTLIYLAILFSPNYHAFGLNGGVNCAACTCVVALLEQLSVIHNDTVINSLEKLCGYFPSTFKNICNDFAVVFGPELINNIWHQNSDLDNKWRQRNNFIVKIDQSHTSLDADICKLPVYSVAMTQALIQTMTDSVYIRPIDNDVEEDSNCNGIKGKDPSTGKAYEDIFCSQSQMRGVVVLGDSVSAHFHLPREWFNTSEFSKAVFKQLPFVLENEFDWPEMSYATGFMNNTYTNINHGPMESVYNKLYKRNHCNHRDYQNIAVNGARSSSMADTIVKSLYRNITTDYPLIIFLALIGNDVCNGHPDTFAHMTTPEEMRNNTLRTLNYLDTTLPKGSHVFLVGLADGRTLYNSLHNRIHPLGSLRNDITYTDFYDYLNCLERANQLSAVLKDIGNKQAKSFKNFNLYFADNPLAQALTAEVVWSNLVTQYPDVIGPVNTNNDKIREIFGDQGGYI
ncbi:hypothetical protein KUTeg_018824 [Tegillarca granosa]|uniref:Acyloxyacyl hydrolase N-terminal domain-containing protein n=1 Tax=Tegillarca granosa TaxID=220873 RepID=A0ABQ9EGQ3_TEGGR|nr:hypothetical protein KUTeg_018824 [Tegillarca granosa]